MDPGAPPPGRVRTPPSRPRLRGPAATTAERVAMSHSAAILLIPAGPDPAGAAIIG